MKRLLFSFLALLLITVPFAAGADNKPVTLYVGPATGTFTVGATFTVSFYVNTGGSFINAIETHILFPADKIQVVSPSTGSSFINVWAIQPSYSNSDGTMTFRGAVPSPGINTSAGLISTVTFRVKSVGNAAIRFSNDSRVLLNDGLGTNVLQHTESGVFSLVLPPPSGPTVVSETHPDQSRWYANNTVSLSWSGDTGAEGYSYTLSDEPVDVPDNISQGAKTYVVYKNVSNGRHYFHIKSLRAGAWGGVTHYAVNIDAEPPATFPVEVVPSARTSQHKPVITFLTTDNDSGLDRYEVKLASLSQLDPEAEKVAAQPFFIEAQSPYIPGELAYGRYDVIVRAYDVAGNYQEVTKRLEIVPALFEVVQGQGIAFRSTTVISWPVFWGLMLLVLLGFGFGARYYWKRHEGVIALRKNGRVPSDVAAKLTELKRLQAKYGKMAILFIALVIAGSLVGAGKTALAERISLPPPVITTISKDIFNDEIFYAGGRTEVPKSEVVLFIQNSEGGQALSYHVPADEKGEWFYHHNGFLPSGSYLIWAQALDDELQSPPSPQMLLVVSPHAFAVGGSKLTYETVYGITIIILILVLALLLWLTLYHSYHSKRKHAKFMEERAKIEETIRRGFALLKRDVDEQLSLLAAARNGAGLSDDEKHREQQLLDDIETIKRNIGEEVWELEKLEGEGSG